MGRAEEQRLPRAPLERKHSWLAALLGASIFSSCFLLTQAQNGSPKVFFVTQKPENAIEGQNVTLTPDGNMDDIFSCNWFRGLVTDLTKQIITYYLPPNILGQVNGAAYTGRETGAPDCSLHIRDLTSADSGNYTVTKEGLVTTVGHVYIEVSESIFSSYFLLTQAQSGSPKVLFVTQKPENAIEGQNVTLTPDGNLDGVFNCNWYRGRILDVTKQIMTYYLPPNSLGQVNQAAYTGRETGAPDCSLHIRNLTTADSGNYTVTKEGVVTSVGHVHVEVSDLEGEAVPPPSESGIYITSLLIIIGSVAVILALIGTLLYFFLRARCQKKRTSTQTITTPALYENLPPSGQIKPGNASADSNIYQSLQPGSQAVYEELKR